MEGGSLGEKGDAWGVSCRRIESWEYEGERGKEKGQEGPSAVLGSYFLDHPSFTLRLRSSVISRCGPARGLGWLALGCRSHVAGPL